MTYETLLVEREGRVALIRLNRPEALNALNDRLLEELSGCVEAPVPVHLRLRRSEGGHGRLLEEAQSRLQRELGDE